MRVLVNRLTALRQKSGMGHYIAELVRCLPADQGSDQVLLYPGNLFASGLKCWQTSKRLIRKLLPARNHAATSSSAPKPRNRDWQNALARQLASWHFKTIASWKDFDIYHEPNYTPWPCNRPTISTIADLSLLLHPHWHPAERARHFARHFPLALKRCTHIITISEFSRSEIIRHLGVAPERVSCTYMGIRPGLSPLPTSEVAPVLARLGLPDQYFLFVGTLEPRKNLHMLMRAYIALPAHLRDRCPLVLAGSWGWNGSGLAEFYAEQARHRGVLHLGYVADADLPALYNGARALVFPSHYEGFGLPPVEMMACGGAVLASTAEAVVETAGSKAHLIHPDDESGWTSAMQRTLTDDDWHQHLRTGTQQLARAYSWERCAAQTWQVYRQVANKDSRLPLRHAA